MPSPDADFDVTRVESMQWNRTVTANMLANGPASVPEVEPVDADVVTRVRDAIRREVVERGA